MAAARLGCADIAVDALLTDTQKNTYLPNGHNYQDKRLRLYMPGNGSLLAAVAMINAPVGTAAPKSIIPASRRLECALGRSAQDAVKALFV